MEQKIKILIADENNDFRANLKNNLAHMNMEIVDDGPLRLPPRS